MTQRKITLLNLCPQCGQQPIFRGLLMNRSCPGCGTIFYRESGYFLGAMVLSYFASSGIGILLLLVLFGGMKVEIITAAMISVATVLLLTPLFYRYSRILWIQLDRRADPESPLKNPNIKS